MKLGIVTNLQDPSKLKVFEGSQRAIVDELHNRVMIDRETRIYHEKDQEVMIFDFEHMRLQISNPPKRLCLGFRIVDISPVSMIPREHDQILISEALSSLWNEAGSNDGSQLTQYLGEYTVISSIGDSVESTDSLHLFVNNYSFVNLEEKYLKTGGAYGCKTFYLWKHIKPEEDKQQSDEEQSVQNKNGQSLWKLVGVVTRHSGSEPSFSADLGNSFKPLDNTTLKSVEYDAQFKLIECKDVEYK